METLKRGSETVKRHPPARKKAAEAQAAAKGPPNEKAAGAQAKQVDKMKAAETGKPQPDSFLAVLRAEIEKAMPQTNDEASKFMEGGEKERMKGAVSGNINQQKDEASSGLRQASSQAPDPNSVASKTVTPIPSEPAAPAPAVDGSQAMPAPRQESEVSLEQSKKEGGKLLEENKLTPSRLTNANDPRFSAVLKSKSQLDVQADAAPKQYRASEQRTLTQAAARAISDGRQGAAALVAAKAKSQGAVSARQAAAKAKDEERRRLVAENIEKIYNQTKLAVGRKLASLETDVVRMFDSGATAAIDNMKASAQREIDAFFAKRYEGLRGAGRWVVDQFRPTPPEVKAILAGARARFATEMDGLVVRVSAAVDSRLKEAKDEIAKGQARIRDYVASLPRDLQEVGKAAEREVSARFEELRQGVDDRKNALAQKLAERYKAAYEEADKALQKMEEENAGLLNGLVEAIGTVIKILTEFKDKLMALLRKGADTIELILLHPIAFLGNLIAAIKQGVSNFVSNIWDHLKRGFLAWLFGALSSAGIQPPADLAPGSLLKLVLQVLGITYERMRAKAVKLIGERNVRILEKLFDYVRTLIAEGPAALWEKIKADVGSLKAMVIDALQDWLITTIIKQATIKLLSMFNPAGAIVQAVIAIYNIVMFLIERAGQIMAFVEAVVGSISAIASGAISSAANWIEQALGRAIPLVIGFLARLIGLGGISQKIKEFITKVQGVVDKAIDKVIAKIVGVVKKLFGAGSRQKAEDAKGESTQSKEVKANIRRELEGKRLRQGEDPSSILNSVWVKYSPMGLKGIRLDPPKQPGGGIDVLVNASLTERIASMKPEDISQLITIGKNMKPYAKATTLYITYNGKPFGGAIKQKRGSAGHAEHVFLKTYAEPLMRTIAREYSQSKLKTPVSIVMDITRLPCKECAESRIIKFLDDARAAYPHIDVKLTIRSTGLTKSESWEDTLKSIIKMRLKGIEVKASDFWEEYEKKARQFEAFDYKGKFFAPWELRDFMSKAAGVKEEIDDATRRINSIPKNPKTLGSTK